jgi:hypothetical protein
LLTVPRAENVGEGTFICTHVCTPPDAATLEVAIARLTHALTTADDTVIPDLVKERAAMRGELRTLREGAAGVVRLEERTRKGPRR